MTLVFSTLYIVAMTIMFLFMLIIMLGGFVMEAIALRKELRQSLDNDEENNDDSQDKSENNKTPSPYEWLAKAHDDESRSK